MEIIVIILGLAVLYLYSKSTTVGVNITTPTGSTLAPVVTTPIPPSGETSTTVITNNNTGQVVTTTVKTTTPPHMKPNAVLMSDSQIALQNISIGFSSSDRTRFITDCLVDLQTEQQSVPGVCNTPQYAGQPLALTTLKDGSLALGAASGLAGAGAFGGGGIGSLAGIGASGFGAAGTAAATVIPVVGIAIGAAISILTAITAHHKAAVGNEDNLSCSLVPSSNYALQVIEQAVVSGNITVQQGQSALSTLLTDFKTQAKNGKSGQFDEGSGMCNALCWYYHFLAAIVMKKQNRYSQYV